MCHYLNVHFQGQRVKSLLYLYFSLEIHPKVTYSVNNNNNNKSVAILWLITAVTIKYVWSCILKELDAGFAFIVDTTCKSSALKRQEYLLYEGKTKPCNDL